MNVPADKPLDERFRIAEQYAFDVTEPARTRPPSPDKEATTCNKAGYCYCPKCNPR